MTKKTAFAALLLVLLVGISLAIGGLTMAQSLATTKSDRLAATFEERWSALHTDPFRDIR